jgi:hypothetical protein
VEPVENRRQSAGMEMNWFPYSRFQNFPALAPRLNVRLWLLADIQVSGDLRPLYPRKQTLPAKNWIGP